MGERGIRIAEATGSTPVSSTILKGHSATGGPSFLGGEARESKRARRSLGLKIAPDARVSRASGLGGGRLEQGDPTKTATLGS